MPTGNTNISVSTINHSWQNLLADSGAGLVQQYVGGSSPVALPAAVTGTISSGVVTFATAPGFTVGQKLGFLWTGGQRVNVSVASVSGVTVTVNTDGTGTTLPTGNASVTVAPAVALPDTQFVGTDAKFILITNTAGPAAVACYDSGTNLLATLNASLAGAGSVYGYYWTYSSGASDPFTGNAVASMVAYNFGTAVSTFQMSVILAT